MTNLTVRVRCVVQQDDQVYTIRNKMSVLHLKQEIYAKHPMSPPIRAQRLIHMGHLLQDDAILSTLLSTSTDNEPTVQIIQLVFPVTHKPATVLPPLERQAPTPAPQPVPQSSSPTPTPPPTLEQRQFSVEQYRLHLQQYQLQMMLQYDAYMRAVMTGTPMSMVNLPSTSSTTVTPPEPAAAEPAPPAAPAADPDGEDGAAPRDLVDYMYMGLRVALIMVTVVMYSSMMRVAAVLVFGGAMWALQREGILRGGLNNLLRAPNAPNPAGPAAENAPAEQAGPAEAAPGGQAEPADPAVPQPGDAMQEGEAVDDADIAAEETTPTTPEVVPVEQPTAWVVFSSTCYSFITGFFLSMIPDGGAHRLPIDDNNNEAPGGGEVAQAM